MTINLLTIIWLAINAYLITRHPGMVLGWLVVIIPTYLIRLQIMGVPTTWLELAVYTIFLIWFIQHFKQKQQIFSWVRDYQWPVLVLGMGLLVGVLVSDDIKISLGIIKGWFIDPVLVAVMVIGFMQPTEAKLRQIIGGLAISGSGLAAIACWQVLTGVYVTVDQRASALFGSANYLSLYLVPIIILAVGLFAELKGQSKWVLGGGIVLMLVGLYFTFSYAGWLALIIGSAIYWLRSQNYWRKWPGVVGAIFILIASQWQLPKFQQMLDLVGRSSSHVRLQVWQVASLMVKEHWLTGIGLGLFQKKYLSYAERLFHPPLELNMLHTHNILLQYLVNTGVLGLLGFIWLVSKWFVLLGRSSRDKHPYALVVCSAMVALLVHGMFDVAYWKNDLAVLFWLIFALGVIVTSSKYVHGEQLSYRN